MSLLDARVRDLRGDIRHWRRGRADTSWASAIGDAYVAVFATVVLGSMVGNVILHLGRIADDACHSAGCRDARALAPWVASAGAVAVVAAVARFVGPVFVTPAIGSWLATTPVSRRALVAPRLLMALVVAAPLPLVAVAAGSLLAGQSVAVSLAMAAAAALVSMAAVAGLAAVQGRARRLTGALVLLLVLAVWVALLALASDRLHLTATATPSTLWPAAAVAAGVAVVAAVVATRRLDRLRLRDLAPGGHVAPGLSGALASLDFALAFDVWLSRRWEARSTVRPRRGGPDGLRALVFTDLLRLLRSPLGLVAPAAAVVVPYAALAAGAAVLTGPVVALVVFVSSLPLLASLRVIAREPGLQRLLPWSRQQSLQACLLVPGVVAVGFGLAVGPAVASAYPVSLGRGFFLGAGLGLVGLAAAVRWMVAAPPDYSRPLVSTPAGAVPMNLYGSAFRGFDIVLLGSAPLLLFSPVTASWLLLVVAGVALGVLIGDR